MKGTTKDEDAWIEQLKIDAQGGAKMDESDTLPLIRVVERLKRELREKSAGHASRDIEQLVRDWRLAKERTRHLQNSIKDSEAAERAAESALAKVIAPADMKGGEVISVWCRIARDQEALITVRKPKNDDQCGTDPLVVSIRGER